jgi:hypothetical protein
MRRDFLSPAGRAAALRVARAIESAINRGLDQMEAMIRVAYWHPEYARFSKVVNQTDCKRLADLISLLSDHSDLEAVA